MTLAAVPSLVRARRVLRVRGRVQGVGFRPYVYRTAVGLGLVGGVSNGMDGVVVDAQGGVTALDLLREALLRAPLPAQVESVEEEPAALAVGLGTFAIRESRATGGTPRVPADLATCETCVAEMFEPGNRRFGYPFIACAHCGPRYTAILEIPYDRSRTAFDAFPPCAPCRAEYEDPRSRRFHAQAIACPDCGPRLFAEGGPAGEPVQVAADILRGGGLIGVRGLGGFHMACDARAASAVARLRRAKHRPDKPLAVMFPDVASLEAACVLEGAARAPLLGPERAIVLLQRRADGGLATEVAPGLAELGVLLPSNGLQHLIAAACGFPLVMTSGNLSDEPIAVTNDEARARLGGMCDLLLLHDRAIPGRADDSVVRVMAGSHRLQRRARGYPPGPFALGFTAPDVLAVGADLKNTLCVTRGDEAFLSPHVGDLEDVLTQEAWAETRARMQRLFRIEPTLVAHDLHPRYQGTELARRSGLPTLAVQHHHAHVASCLVDNERTGPVLGVAWDGTGFGVDGTVWGGEFLVADLGGCVRRGRLRPLAMAGGDAAVRGGWRMAVSALMDAGLDPSRVAVPGAAVVARMIEQQVATVPSSSMGRLFDVVASLCGLRQVSGYEGQAAVELEAIAAGEGEPYPMPLLQGGELLELDTRPLVRAIITDVEQGVVAGAVSARFHATLAAALTAVCRVLREDTGLATVALTGGCFANRRLTELAARRLGEAGFEVLLHSRVPAGDGGLALGQAAVAAWSLRHVPGHSR